MKPLHYLLLAITALYFFLDRKSGVTPVEEPIAVEVVEEDRPTCAQRERNSPALQPRQLPGIDLGVARTGIFFAMERQ